MTSRRAFLAGAGALAVSPLLPAIPAAAEVEVISQITPATVPFDAALGGLNAGVTYHVWFVRNAKGVIDMLATTEKNPTLPRGYQLAWQAGTINRERIA